MKILKINRNKIYLENDEIIDVDMDIINIFKLKEELEISDIYDEIIKESMLKKSIYLIYLKDRTAFDIKEKLKLKYSKKNHNLIDEIIMKLINMKLINDLDYAERYIETNISMGIEKIKSKLKYKGIKREFIDKALSNLDEILIENQIIEIKKFISKNQNIEKKKLISKLLNKGYRFKDILNVFNE